jgi:hypothetical protein
LKVEGEAVAVGEEEGVLAGIGQSQNQKMKKHLMMRLQQKRMDCRHYH